MSNLAVLPQNEYALIVLNGSDKGSIYKLMVGKISLGREVDNNIIITGDPKISRHHALLTITSSGVEVKDISDRNIVTVNGEEITRQILASGHIIQLGNTQFQFKIVPAGDPLTANRALTSLSSLQDRISKGLNKKKSANRRPQNSKMTFYIISLGVILLFVWLLSSTPAIKNTVNIRSDDDLRKDIMASEKIIENVQSERQRLGENTPQYQEAQPNFIRGFRDYRKGQYERAIDSFRACLSLFPQHVQCERYLHLAEKKFSELIQYHMVLAHKYKEQNQFSACKASYRNALVMINDPSNKSFQEAMNGYKSCEALEGDHY